jgi:hypothetical protein
MKKTSGQKTHPTVPLTCGHYYLAQSFGQIILFLLCPLHRTPDWQEVRNHLVFDTSRIRQIGAVKVKCANPKVGVSNKPSNLLVLKWTLA